jgi:hypothetical protein
VLASGAIGCGAITSTGNISTSSASGTITAPSGGFLIGPYKNAATATASITAAGVITGASLGLGTGAITCGAISSSGLITADGGLTVPSGDTLLSNGTLTCSGAINANGGLTVASGQLLTATGTGILSGRSSFGSASMPYTISSSAINQTYHFYIHTTAGTLTIPSASAASNQVLVIRSIIGATNSITSTSNIWPIGTGTFVTAYTLVAYGSIVLHSDGGTWYQIL